MPALRLRHARLLLSAPILLSMAAAASALPQCPTGNLLSDAQFGPGTTMSFYTNNNVVDQWLEERAVIESGPVGCITPTTPGVPGMLHLMEAALSASQVRQVVVLPAGPSVAGDVATLSARFNSPTAGSVCSINLWDGTTLVPIPGASSGLVLDSDCSTWEEIRVCVPIPAGTERLNIDLIFTNGTIPQGGFVDEAYLDVCGCGPQSLGVSYCQANPNSTGVPAELTAAGSSVASDGDVTLGVAQMPFASFGFFITSRVQGFANMPAGSSGNLCLGGAIGRYVGPGQIQQALASGEISLTLDLAMTPQPNGFVPILGGETWNFQAWYRDSLGGIATSNFTNGLEVVFQ